jgi:hypothetical protein
MKPKADLDPELPAFAPRRLWPFRSIWQVMVAVAAIGLFLAASVTLARQPLSSVVFWNPGLAPANAEPARLAFYPAPDKSQEPLVIACPIDGRQPEVVPHEMRPPIVKRAPEPIDSWMVLRAPGSIDPKMVLRAPEWIDPNMVFKLEAEGDRDRAEQGELPQILPEAAPGGGQEPNPVLHPDGSLPPAKKPR